MIFSLPRNRLGGPKACLLLHSTTTRATPAVVLRRGITECSGVFEGVEIGGALELGCSCTLLLVHVQRNAGSLFALPRTCILQDLYLMRSTSSQASSLWRISFWQILLFEGLRDGRLRWLVRFCSVACALQKHIAKCHYSNAIGRAAYCKVWADMYALTSLHAIAANVPTRVTTFHLMLEFLDIPG